MTLVAKMRLEARLQIWVRLDAPKQWPTKFSPLRNKDEKKRTDFPQLNLWHSCYSLALGRALSFSRLSASLLTSFPNVFNPLAKQPAFFRPRFLSKEKSRLSSS
ncbi:hypothetical protein F2Q69_00034485 [Brassica cretica]|uniref:Uncharacterized protein n=1 Tax=Brassica cretica TaxID=69181 RepID=A0A8S9SBU5_BRACR|nr:hypothetical protein F2Q69_00034485 [Brassica cretica]